MIFKNPIKNRFKDKHLTATYNLIALNIKESFHIKYVDDCTVLKRIFSKKFISFFLLRQSEQPGAFNGV